MNISVDNSDEPVKEAVAQAGAQTMIWHHLFAFAAIIVGGFLTDRMVKKLPRFRLAFQIIAMLCGAPCLVLVGFVPSAAAMVAMSATYGVFRGAFEVDSPGTVPDKWRKMAMRRPKWDFPLVVG